MQAHAVVRAVRRGRTTVLDTVRSQPPLLLRATPAGLMLVGGAAGPLGGDRLRLTVEIGAGASLTVRSVAASMALPGRGRSTLDVDVTVADGATLDWAPEPLISAAGSDHRQTGVVDLAGTASLRWQESLVFGRSGEPNGELTSSLRVSRSGRPLLHNEFSISPEQALGRVPSALLGGARCAVSELRVGPGAVEEQVLHDRPDLRVGLFILDDDAVMISALGQRLETTRAAVEHAVPG